ncbi:MAG: hypothetical protein LZ173_10435 [Thaumarchaeota archaeon]|nr:hypothetical protein [Candidatus Geocrenenecus arthurdayi]
MISVYGGVMGVLDSRHLRDIGMLKVFKQIARYLAGFFKEYDGEVEGGIIEDV